jgi:hypothetical protein
MGGGRSGQLLVRLVALVGLVVSPLVLAVAASGPAGAAVSDEAGFRLAWTTQATGTIDLGANIVLGCNGVSGAGVSVRNLATAIVVDGHGHSITQTCHTSSNDNHVLEQDGEGDVTLQNLTITGGNDTEGDNGGGVDMTNSSSPSLTIVNSTIAGNQACGVGGGIAHRTTGAVTITNSTISGNTSGTNGGGIDVDEGQLTVTNSTITGNTSANSEAGGIDSDASQGVKLVYTTLVGNTVDPTVSCPGGASASHSTSKPSPAKAHAQAAPSAVLAVNLFTSSDETFQAFGTVIANPMVAHTTQTPANCLIDSAPTSLGFNYANDTTCDFTAGTDRQASTNDPKLGPLGANGGPTQTIVPLTGSPLIDAIPDPAGGCPAFPTITTDQRGVARPQGPGCDIGAVEVVVVTPTPLVVTPRFTG